MGRSKSREREEEIVVEVRRLGRERRKERTVTCAILGEAGVTNRRMHARSCCICGTYFGARARDRSIFMFRRRREEFLCLCQ